jgi:hypothetical protein
VPGRRNRGGANAIAAGRASRKETCRRERCRHAPGRLLLVARFKVVIVLIVVAHARFGLWFVSSHTLGTRPPPACVPALACRPQPRVPAKDAPGPAASARPWARSLYNTPAKKKAARETAVLVLLSLSAFARLPLLPSRGSCSLYLYCTKRAFDAVPRPMEPPERAARGR